MNLTIGGLFLLLLIAYSFFSQKNILEKLFFISFAFSMFIEIGYVFSIGNIQIDYSDFMLFLTALYGLIFIKIKLNYIQILLGFLLLLLTFCGYMFILLYTGKVYVMPLSEGIYGFVLGVPRPNYVFSLEQIKNIIRMFFFIPFALFFYAYSKRNPNFYKKLISFIIKFSIIFTIIFEGLNIFSNYVSKSSSYFKILALIFGLGSSQNISLEDIYRANLYAIQSTYREPSAMALFIFFLFILLILNKDFFSKKQLLIFTFLYLVFEFTTLSTTGFAMSLIILVFLIVFLLKGASIFRIIISISVLILLFTFSIYFVNSKYFMYSINKIKILSEFNSNNSNLSVNGRSYSILNNIMLSIKYPFLGVGLGSTASTSILASLLANIGIFGTLIYFLFLFLPKVKLSWMKFFILIVLVFFIMFSGNLALAFSPAFLLVVSSFTLSPIN